jgi:hypothetical protein
MRIFFFIYLSIEESVLVCGSGGVMNPVVNGVLLGPSSPVLKCGKAGQMVVVIHSQDHGIGGTRCKLFVKETDDDEGRLVMDWRRESEPKGRGSSDGKAAGWEVGL